MARPKNFFCGLISITPIIQLLHCLGRDMTWGEYTKIMNHLQKSRENIIQIFINLVHLLLHHRRKKTAIAFWVMYTPLFCLFSTHVWFHGFSHSQLNNNGKTMAAICCQNKYSWTSTNGHVTSWHQSLFFVRADSPYFDSFSNLSVTATSLQQQLILPLKRVPNCKNNLSKTVRFFSHWWKSQKWSWSLIHIELHCALYDKSKQSYFDCDPLILLQ